MEIHNPNRLDWISGTRNSGILIEFVLKVYIFTDDMILYIENPKEYAKNYQLIEDFYRVVRYKVSKQKSIKILCICNEQLKWN